MSAAKELIAAELRGEIPLDVSAKRAARLAGFGPEWIARDEACRILSIAWQTFLMEHRAWGCIETRPASDRAESARGCGLLLRRSDVERLASIRRRCRCSVGVACRIYAAIKAGGPL